jgi:hypothetical protein
MDTSKFSQEEPGTQSKRRIACQKKRECAQPMNNPAGRDYYNRLLNLREGETEKVRVLLGPAVPPALCKLKAWAVTV